MKMIHGGDLSAAAQHWSIPEDQWLDLSTAISPFSYPLPSPPQEIWQRLPYISNELIQAAQNYYQCGSVLPVAGTQQAIELLPQVLSGDVVAVPRIGYSEHEKQWRLVNREIIYYENLEELKKFISDRRVDIAVVINPNNPTGTLYPREQLIDIANDLSKKKGYLIIDEAFIDTQPNLSLAMNIPSNTIILRSIGKFFGLAGIRVGFVITNLSIINVLQEKAGLWRISGMSQWGAIQAVERFFLAEKTDQTFRKQLDKAVSLFKTALARGPFSATKLFCQC